MHCSLVLCRLGPLAVFAMTCFGLFKFVIRVFRWGLGVFLRWIYNPLVGFVRLAILWRTDHGSRGELEVEEGHEEEDQFDDEDHRVDPSDELHCDYDSTWETEQRPQRTVRRAMGARGARGAGEARRSSHHFNRFERAASDMQNYRHDYPGQRCYQSSDDKPNLDFYLGRRPCVPDNLYIYDFFKTKSENHYNELESVHTYIQWLFPLQEPGVNPSARTLTKEEIKEFLASSTAKENLLKSYELMLDFYGIELCDKKSGKVERASNWRDRFNNMNSRTHNSLRITRILKCLGTLGYCHYQYPLVDFFLKETLVRKELPNLKDSVLNYFVFAVLDKRQRRKLLKFAYLHYEPKDEFVWCPLTIQRVWSAQTEAKAQREFDDVFESNPRSDCCTVESKDETEVEDC